MSVFFKRRGDAPEIVKLDPIFSNNSWENIIWACQNDKVPSTWAVADHKDMTINNTTYQIDIIGKNHDVYTAGGTAPLTFQMHDCYADEQKMNSTQINRGGWNSCMMRIMLLPTILNSMPTVVKNAIREVNKLSSAGMQSSSIDTTSDKLFLLSEIEIFGSIKHSKSGEGNQYAYYAAGNTKVKNKAGSRIDWWERSPVGSANDKFCCVFRDGSFTAAMANYSRGVAFAFCF